MILSVLFDEKRTLHPDSNYIWSRYYNTICCF